VRGLAHHVWPALALACACGGGSSGAAADAAAPDASLCPFPPGRSYVLADLSVRPADQGSDFDGDGLVGNLPQSARDAIHDGIAQAIAVGDANVAIHVMDWADPPTATDRDLSLEILSAADTDQPPDPSNNLTGSGTFYALMELIDLNCQSTTLADSAEIVDSVLTARRARWSVPITIAGGGTITMLDATLGGTFDAEFDRIDGYLDFEGTLCSLSQMPFPGDISGTLLDALINDPVIDGAVQIDVDVDGDGLEQVIGDGVSVAECIDGDGTHIAGKDCPCSAEIQDAISGSLALEGVRAYILGYR
jgi:hypothetical protein